MTPEPDGPHKMAKRKQASKAAPETAHAPQPQSITLEQARMIFERHEKVVGEVFRSTLAAFPHMANGVAPILQQDLAALRQYLAQGG